MSTKRWGFPWIVLLFVALTTHKVLVAEEVSCGQRMITYQGYIKSGLPTHEGDWPWHAAIFRKESKGENYICGGSIISKNFVVTAAHCTFELRKPLLAERFTAKLGLHNKSFPSEHSKVCEIAEILRHKAYNISNLKNDIALLRTDEDITYSDYIQPVCLWPEKSSNVNIDISTGGTVVGWGLNHEDIMPDILQQATLSIVDNGICLKSYAHHFSRILSKDNSNYCAGNKNKTNVCEGDSGGGMYFRFKTTWYIRGIVSAGVRDDRNCNPTHYVTFSDIPFYLKWIAKHQRKAKTRNLLNLGNCGLDSHHSTILEKDKPLFLQYPWTAILEFKVEGSSTITTHCNGALIHPRFVITAGHCVDSDFTKIKLKSVRLGEYDRKTNPDQAKHTDGKEISTNIQSIDIEEVFKHPDFNKPRYNNNIALLKLKYPADIDRPNVKPICLPTSEDFNNDNYTITGWKRIGSQADLLTRNTVVLESSDVCSSIVQNIDINITENMQCGTYLNDVVPDGSHYMSGALLQYVKNADRKNRYFLKGLLSFGFPNCSKNYTNMFTSIHGYTEWISKIVERDEN